LSYIDPYPPNVLLVPKLEPELKTPVSEEHATFERFLNELNNYLQGILQVKQGKTYGQLVPDADRTKEEYDPAKLKGILETLVSPLLKHVSRLIIGFGFVVDGWLVDARNCVVGSGESQVYWSHCAETA
jgi:hypothetical protein